MSVGHLLVDSALFMDDFAKPKIVYREIGTAEVSLVNKYPLRVIGEICSLCRLWIYDFRLREIVQL